MKNTQEPVKPATKKAAPHKEAVPAANKLALVLIRGLINIRTDIRDTLFTLRLRQKHVCVVIEDTPSNRAAAMKCKDYIAYGEIDGETHKLLVEKRARKDSDGTDKKYFTLAPPRGGFEKGGIKNSFTNKGALGYRGAKMNDLIRKMI